ncbi:MAG: glycoside hydrolase family 16 protein [Actinobacteria bacterium]|nr:glycoside hydrolase family 16 protein [Actinomycetota bacterium]
MNNRLRRRLIFLVPLLLCVSVSVAPVWSSSRPLVRFVKAPPARTHSADAEFRFKTKAKRTWCRLDRLRYRRCRSRVKYSGVCRGRHTFIVRARYRGRTRFVHRRWIVRYSGRTPAAERPPRCSDSSAGSGSGSGPPAVRKLIFADEFNGTTLDTAEWGAYDSPGHAGNGLRRPSAFSLDGQGHLVVTAQMVNGTIVSGGMANRLQFTYGRVEFRVRTEPDPTGTMNANVLTWPQNQWSPEFTENDMYETGPHVDNRRRFDTYIHFGTANWQTWTTHYVDPSQWHTVAMEWYPGLLEIYVDGVFDWSVSDRAAIPDILHHLTIQLDAMATRTLTQPVRMYVDYVRVYQ